MPRYELIEGSSNKFWEIELSGTSFTTVFGRIGTSGQSSTKDFDSEDKANKEYAKIVAEKVKKGYSLVGGGSSTSAAPKKAKTADVKTPNAKVSKANIETPAATEPAEVQKAEAPELASSDERDDGAIRIDWTDELLKEIKKAKRTTSDPLDRTYSYRMAWDAAIAEKDKYLITLAEQTYAGPRKRLRYDEAPSARSYDATLEAPAFRAGGHCLSGLVAYLADHLPPHTVIKGVIEADIPPHRQYRAATDLLSTLPALKLDAEAAKSLAVEMWEKAPLAFRAVLAELSQDAEMLEWVSKHPDSDGNALPLSTRSVLNLSTSTLTSYFAKHAALDTYHIRSGWRQVAPVLPFLLLDAKKEEAIEPLIAWAKRALEDKDANAIQGILAAMQFVSNAPKLVEVAILAMNAWEKTVEDGYVQKDQSPVPASVALLRRNAKFALPLVKQAALEKHKWAKDLLPELERSANSGPVALAASNDVPAELNVPFKKKPAFFSPGSLTRPTLKTGASLPDAAIDGLGALLQSGEHKTIASLKTKLDTKSLAQFGWDVFQAWLIGGAPSKEKWALMGLGVLGNDDTARKLASLIRVWPGESQHQRAVNGLDVLAEIGSDVALMMLNGIAQKVKFKGLQDRARGKMDDIAKTRGLSAEELADRLVPDLDLDDDGSKVLDFGPRSFRVGFDESLSPFVMDASGARLKDLPKPNSKDEAELANAASESWKAMKKDARTLSSMQLARLELAMGTQRRWAPDTFTTFLVGHPLLFHVVRRLVWGVYDQEDNLVETFRVAEDRTLASIEDSTFSIENAFRVGIAHLIEIESIKGGGEVLAKWRQIFSDYEILQPFDQLNRSTFKVESKDYKGYEISKFDGRVVEARKMLGLQNKGWRRGTPQDGGCISEFYKPIKPGLDARIEFEGIMAAGGMDYNDPTLTLKFLSFGDGEIAWQMNKKAVNAENINPVVVSEVLRDIESLGEYVQP